MPWDSTGRGEPQARVPWFRHSCRPRLRIRRIRRPSCYRRRESRHELRHDDGATNEQPLEQVKYFSPQQISLRPDYVISVSRKFHSTMTDWPRRVAKDLIRRQAKAARERIITVPFPITFDELAGAVEASARSAGTSNSTGRTRRIFKHLALGASANET